MSQGVWQEQEQCLALVHLMVDRSVSVLLGNVVCDPLLSAALSMNSHVVQRESSSGGSPDSMGGEVQSHLNSGSGNAGPIQTPITTALGLMHKMEGVARLLGGTPLHLHLCEGARHGPIQLRLDMGAVCCPGMPTAFIFHDLADVPSVC